MYKITLYDCCCSPICDGTVSFYTDSLEDFESKWLPKIQDREPERVERYFRSKGGEIVTDYYSDDPSLNIVQEDSSAEVLEEQSFEENDLDITLHNIYRWPGDYHMDSLKYTLRKIRFQGDVIIVAKYHIKGGYMKAPFHKEEVMERIDVWGNPVLKARFKSPARQSREDTVRSPEAFANDEIESFVWLPLNIGDIHRLNEKELDFMMRDIPGEAG